jgi:hypothetical protein
MRSRRKGAWRSPFARRLTTYAPLRARSWLGGYGETSPFPSRVQARPVLVKREGIRRAGVPTRAPDGVDPVSYLSVTELRRFTRELRTERGARARGRALRHCWLVQATRRPRTGMSAGRRGLAGVRLAHGMGSERTEEGRSRRPDATGCVVSGAAGQVRRGGRAQAHRGQIRTGGKTWASHDGLGVALALSRPSPTSPATCSSPSPPPRTSKPERTGARGPIAGNTADATISQPDHHTRRRGARMGERRAAAFASATSGFCRYPAARAATATSHLPG